MGLLDMFKGKIPEELERRGDELFLNESFGPAKIEYEKALAKHEKRGAEGPNFESRIKEKITRAKEALAENHYRTAKDLIETDCLDDAKELLKLVMDLSEDKELMADVEILLNTVKEKTMQQTASTSDMLSYEEPGEDIDEEASQWLEEEEYFNALISALPGEEQDAYSQYGEDFVNGYIALNQGDFPLAEACLTRALEDNSDEKTFIPIELATCYLNMGEYEKAKHILQPFLDDFPYSLRAYQVMCEILWGAEDYDSAGRMLYDCPDEISSSPMINMLKGETLIHAGKLKEAERFYKEFINLNGRDEIALRSLAGVYDMLGETATAKDLYGELLNACKDCGRRADAHLKQRFADTSFDLGERTTGILELYLDLANGDPFNRGVYYTKVSEIYSALGNEKEAARFRGFSEKELRKE